MADSREVVGTNHRRIVVPCSRPESPPPARELPDAAPAVRCRDKLPDRGGNADWQASRFGGRQGTPVIFAARLAAARQGQFAGEAASAPKSTGGRRASAASRL